MQQKICIFGEVGPQTLESVRYQLDALDQSEPILVEINSDGGAVADGIAIYNLLRTWRAGVITEVVGWALSIASVILMAGQTRRAHESALLMVHAPWTRATGNAEDFRGTAELLDQVRETMMHAYVATGQSDAVIATWLDGSKDHWFTAREAMARGLVTEVVAEVSQDPATPANAQATKHRIPPHFLLAQLSRSKPMPQANHPNPGDNSAESIRAAAIQAEGLRRNSIATMFAKPIARGVPGAAELQAQCERDVTCTPQAAGMKILDLYGRDAFPIGGSYTPNMGGDDRVSDFKAAATDTLLARAGIRVADPHPGARDLARMGFVAMAETYLSLTGKTPADRTSGGIVHAMLTTSDFPSVLGNIANKSAQRGYQMAGSGHRQFTSERDVSDFRLQTLVNLSETPSLELKTEGGEYRHGSLSDSAMTFQLATYGKALKLSREMLVNDDLGSFARLAQQFGAAAARLEADKVFAVLNDNANLADGNALFHATHGNLAGSAAALSVTSLGLARAAMRKQKGLAGLDFIDVVPKVLIVPVALETTAEQLIATLVDPSKSNDTANLEFVRKLTLVADPRLDVSSATAWYLSADPNQMDGIIRAYLAGEDRPFLDEEIQFKNDAIAYKVRLDFATGVVDWRGLYKNAGA